MNQFSACIVEDEKISREALTSELSESEHFSVLGNASSVNEAITLISEKKPDVVFMDIKLDTGDAFHVMETLIAQGHKLPAVILNTAYSKFELSQMSAMNEYSKYVTYFLEKPFWHDWKTREKEIVKGIQAYYNLEQEDIKFTPEKLSISKEYKTYFMDFDELLYIEVPTALKGEGKIEVVTVEEKYLLNGSLRKISSQLPVYFKQISRFCIVNTKFIRMSDRSDQVIKLKNVDRIFGVGDSFKDDLYKLLNI